MRVATPAIESPKRSAMPSVVSDVLQSPGQPLDGQTRAFFEGRLGHDFGRVRVHSDHIAAQSAQAINAAAYTVDRDLVFNSGAYSPFSPQGRWLLAHELTHVIQQQGVRQAAEPLRVGDRGTRQEVEAHRAADSVFEPQRRAPEVNTRTSAGVIQRFATNEHIAIGAAAYDRAKPQDQPGAATPGEPAIAPAFVQRLREFRYKRATGATLTYGQLVAAADDFTSLAVMEQRDREKAGKGIRIPVLSPIWDWLGDTSHYLDLAARNLQHFHPHNFMAWQAWQWTALRIMGQGRVLIEEAHEARRDVKALLDKFDAHNRRARAAIQELDTLTAAGGNAAREAELQRTVEDETKSMQTLLAQAAARKKLADEKTELAADRAQRSVTINGFGNHFLTDAFAAGHIVTPRADLLRDYSTKLLGVIPVGGVLNCANIPSLAWHDLDNAFGVQVNNLDNQAWLTYGDDYANKDALPGGKTLGPTMEHAVDATATSLKQLWIAASGPVPSSLSPVLNKLPRPNLDKYPRWQPQQWELQLRYAAGESVGVDYSAVGSSSPQGSAQPREQVPNPKGQQIGASLLSARATCINLLPVFSYDKFVLPMLATIRREYAQRFYVGSAAQTVSPDAVPKPQQSVVGHVIGGSLIGGLSGALIGLAVGGPLGAVVGAIGGLLVGGLIGGLIGKKRREDEPAV